MLNFTGKLRDVTTLAHELGHGLHDRLASKQHIFDYHPPLTLAETASVFGEALTFDRIMAEEKDPKVRLAMLCTQCEDAFATVFRQVAFNRFEDACHTARREEGELAVEQLGELYQAKLQPMFGDALILTDEHKVWWSYVEPLPAHAGLRVRLRVRQPAGAVGLPPVPRAGARVRGPVPRLPGRRRLDAAG